MLQILLLIGAVLILAPILGWLFLGAGVMIGFIAQLFGGLAMLVVPGLALVIFIRIFKRKK